ncbi:hypothetical protein POM88_045076 [Heracleum sosnowskyi]|uniref:Ubiquitin-like protease family profile domain-containing protein n=1 Tax=Heracleum sosnowskyi TaxID=360622 RepID=A0AAD8M5V7_9APIA|nr:hypothetical protein POM88_045076 [Heracleum sosnowskyi]
MHEGLKDDVALPLWPGCTKASRLSAVLTLYNLKVGHQISDAFFTEMLTAVSDLLPDGTVLPQFIPNVDAIGLPIDRHSGRIDGEGVTGDLHKQTITLEYPSRDANWVEVEHNRTFIDWFKNHVTDELLNNKESISDRIKWLSRGPDAFVDSYKCYLINGYTFYTKEHDATSTMQNSGVAITATSLHQSNEEVDVMDDPFGRANISTNISDDDDECYYIRNDHDEGEYVNPEFLNVHGHERSKIMASGSHGTSGTDATNDTNVTEKRSKRGIVNMLKVKKTRNKGIVQEVNWNELGQPIGRASMTLAYFVGSYARRNFPITCDNWRNKNLRSTKEALWDEVKFIWPVVFCLKRLDDVSICFGSEKAGLDVTVFDQQTFNGVEEEHKEKIISHAGTLHRQFRTRLRKMSRDKNGNYSAKPPPLYAHLSTVAPCWKDFVEHSKNDVFVIAEKIKSGETNPVVSRLDAWEYARRNKNGVVDDPVTQQVLEDVIAISNQLEEHELTNIGTDDLLARLIPLEYSGRVRAIGWGGYVPGGPSGGSSHMDNFDMDDDVNSDHIDDYDNFLSEDLPEGKNPCYLYLDPGHRYVGRGILWNDLNDRMLHGVQLEDGYVRVQFEVAAPSELKTKLPRPCDEANLVGDAPGYFLAWPRKLVSMNLEVKYLIYTPKNQEQGKNVEKNKNAIRQEKLKDKEKEKIVESTGVSSKQLGYPLPQDVSHDGVSELVRVAVMLDRVNDLEIEMGPFWDGNPWTEHINKENVLEVLNEQWLSASSLAFYIRYLCEVYLSKNPNLAANYSFASPHIVSHFVNISEASTNLAKLMLGYVDKEHLLFVPYNVSEHWVLVAINTRTENIYFMDPAPKATIVKYKNLKLLIETALKSFRTGCGKIHPKMAFNSFKWMNVSFTRSSRLMCYGYDKMVRFRDNWAGFLYNRFLKGKLLNL